MEENNLVQSSFLFDYTPRPEISQSSFVAISKEILPHLEAVEKIIKGHTSDENATGQFTVSADGHFSFWMFGGECLNFIRSSEGALATVTDFRNFREVIEHG